MPTRLFTLSYYSEVGETKRGDYKSSMITTKAVQQNFLQYLYFFKDFVRLESNMPYLHLIITTHQSKRGSHLSNNFYFHLSTQWIPQAFEK